MTRAVVLAAGTGQRLGGRTANTPKPLVTVGGLPLIAHTISGLAAAGVAEALVVTGYHCALVRAALARENRVRLTFAENRDFAKGASYSLRAARAFAGEAPFLLVMSDHLLSGELLARLIAAGEEAPPGLAAIVATDDPDRWDAAYLAEATRVDAGPDGRVRQIGKLIEPWTAIDAGAFYCFPALWPLVDDAPEDCDLSTILRLAARSGSLAAADITGAFWYDVDTEEDLQAAERLLCGS